MRLSRDAEVEQAQGRIAGHSWGPEISAMCGGMATDIDAAGTHEAAAGADGAAADMGPSLEALVSRLLEDDPALKQSLSRLDLEADQLLKLVQPHEAEIRRSATAEVESLLTAAAQLEGAHELERASEARTNHALRRIYLARYTRRSILIVVSVALVVISGLVLLVPDPGILTRLSHTSTFSLHWSKRQ